MSALRGGRSRHYRGRFAPSPSGWLHLGNARTALLAWVRARRADGRLVMRVEDLDHQRTKDAAVLGNLAELRWLGIDWDEGPDVGGAFGPYRQSERLELYAAALDTLRDAGHLIESYLSRREVAEIAASYGSTSAGVDDAGEGQPDAAAGLYGPAHRARDEQLASERASAGRPVTLRFASPQGTIGFHDQLRGAVSLSPASEVGDFIVRRADGLIAYQLATVVDDAAMRVTEVVRGADLLSSTAAQLLLYRALELPAPAFAHAGLLLDQHGEKLSKRHGPLSLRELELGGVRPERVVGLLAHTLGWLPELAELTASELLASSSEVGSSAAATSALAADRRLADAELAWLLS